MKKVMMSSLLIAAAVLFSCEKEEVKTNVESSKDVTEKSAMSNETHGDHETDSDNITKEVGDELCSCTGYQLVRDEESGSYSCPPPDKDCAKVQPCPCDAIADVGLGLSAHFDKNNFDHFQEALENNTLSEFFTSKSWVGVFNKLKEKPELHDALKSGDATVVEYIQSDKAYYIVVDAGLDHSDWVQASDALITLEVPISEL